MNKDVLSGVVGAGLFGAAYLALALPISPALAVGGVAFLASELVISSNKKIQEKLETTFKEQLIEAKKDIK